MYVTAGHRSHETTRVACHGPRVLLDAAAIAVPSAALLVGARGGELREHRVPIVFDRSREAERRVSSRKACSHMSQPLIGGSRGALYCDRADIVVLLARWHQRHDLGREQERRAGGLALGALERVPHEATDRRATRGASQLAHGLFESESLILHNPLNGFDGDHLAKVALLDAAVDGGSIGQLDDVGLRSQVSIATAARVEGLIGVGRSDNVWVRLPVLRRLEAFI